MNGECARNGRVASILTRCRGRTGASSAERSPLPGQSWTIQSNWSRRWRHTRSECRPSASQSSLTSRAVTQCSEEVRCWRLAWRHFYFVGFRWALARARRWLVAGRRWVLGGRLRETRASLVRRWSEEEAEIERKQSVLLWWRCERVRGSERATMTVNNRLPDALQTDTERARVYVLSAEHSFVFLSYWANPARGALGASIKRTIAGWQLMTLE